MWHVNIGLPLPGPAGRPQKAVYGRFYIMELPRRGLSFDRITYHERVTQCLGATGERPW